MTTILICFGTRPEYIKVKSLIDNLDNTKTLFTGQHLDLIKNIECDYTLTITNSHTNRLNNIVSSILQYDYIFTDIDYVLIQGDTTSAMAMALSAYHHHKKIIHLEAGLRTHNIYNPYPEEANRQIISRLASIHLCPSEQNKSNLISEKVSGEIYVTGNTGLDNINRSNCFYGSKVLITLHRRDNHHIIDHWFNQFSQIAKKYTNLTFILPLHPNPNVTKHKHLLKNINVVPPMEHHQLIKLIKECKFIISDSGGIQEEAAFLNKKVIVCRETTERTESVGEHSVMCIDPADLMDIVECVNDDYEIDAICPYGDGRSWIRIKKILQN